MKKIKIDSSDIKTFQFYKNKPMLLPLSYSNMVIIIKNFIIETKEVRKGWFNSEKDIVFYLTQIDIIVYDPSPEAKDWFIITDKGLNDFFYYYDCTYFKKFHEEFLKLKEAIDSIPK